MVLNCVCIPFHIPLWEINSWNIYVEKQWKLAISLLLLISGKGIVRLSRIQVFLLCLLSFLGNHWWGVRGWCGMEVTRLFSTDMELEREKGHS